LVFNYTIEGFGKPWNLTCFFPSHRKFARLRAEILTIFLFSDLFFILPLARWELLLLRGKRVDEEEETRGERGRGRGRGRGGCIVLWHALVEVADGRATQEVAV
jgi:hypothetical protein